MRALGIEVQDGAIHHGGPIRYSPQLATRTQDGKFGIGTSRATRNLWLKAARQGMCQVMARTGACTHEQEDVWWKLQDDTEPNPDQRQTLGNWLAAVRRKRKRDWAEWKKTQHKRFVGSIYRSAVMSKAEDGYTSMRAEPDGEDTIETRLTRPLKCGAHSRRRCVHTGPHRDTMRQHDPDHEVQAGQGSGCGRRARHRSSTFVAGRSARASHARPWRDATMEGADEPTASAP